MLIPFHDTHKRPYARLRLTVADDTIRLQAAPSPEREAENEPGEGPERVFALDDLRRYRWWSDCNVVGLSLTGAVLPVRAECLEPRQYELSHVFVNHPNVAVLLYVPDTEARYSDMAVMPLLGPGTDLICNLPVAAACTPARKTKPTVAVVMPRLHLAGPNTAPPDSTVFCAVQARQNGQPYPGLLDVYLGCVNGFLPKTRLRVGDASVTFPVLTTGLEPGDTIKVKAGFRYMTAQAEHGIRIAADEGVPQ